METVGLLLFGAVVGLISGVMGIGGGIVLVPGLMILFGFSQSEAQGTSLAVLSIPVVIFAAFVYYQNGFVRLPVVGLIVVGFGVGAYIGARLVTHLPAETLRLSFGVLLLYLGLLFVFDIRPTRPAAALPGAVAAIVAFLLRKIMRRRQSQLPPAVAPTEYHI